MSSVKFESVRIVKVEKLREGGRKERGTHPSQPFGNLLCCTYSCSPGHQSSGLIAPLHAGWLGDLCSYFL